MIHCLSSFSAEQPFKGQLAISACTVWLNYYIQHLDSHIFLCTTLRFVNICMYLCYSSMKIYTFVFSTFAPLYIYSSSTLISVFPTHGSVYICIFEVSRWFGLRHSWLSYGDMVTSDTQTATLNDYHHHHQQHHHWH